MRGSEREGGCSDCNDVQKVRRGCNGEGTWHVGGKDKNGNPRYVVHGCPEKLLTQERLEVIGVWTRWKMFGAPFEGGWAEWPARLVDVLEALELEDRAVSAGKAHAGG